MKQTLCIDCGKRISPIASRCKSCSNKFRAGKYNHKNRKPPSKETIRKQVEGRKGYKTSEETKKKLSLANKGKTRSKEFRERMREVGKKRKHTSKSKNKMSQTMKKLWRNKEYRGKATICKKGKKNPMYGRCGESCPVFNNYSSREPYGKKWCLELKKQIATRDGYICKYCGKIAIRVSGPHHINYNKRDCRPINLVWVHNRCNAKFNTKREHWIDFWCKRLNISRGELNFKEKNTSEENISLVV